MLIDFPSPSIMTASMAFYSATRPTTSVITNERAYLPTSLRCLWSLMLPVLEFFFLPNFSLCQARSESLCTFTAGLRLASGLGD